MTLLTSRAVLLGQSAGVSSKWLGLRAVKVYERDLSGGP